MPCLRVLVEKAKRSQLKGGGGVESAANGGVYMGRHPQGDAGIVQHLVIGVCNVRLQLGNYMYGSRLEGDHYGTFKTPIE